MSGGFKPVLSARGREMLQCNDCGGWARPDYEAEHRCPRDATGQMWRREALRDPYRERFTCPGCGGWTERIGEVLAHFCDGAEAVAGFKADLERAIWEARREGYRRALADTFSMLEALPPTQVTLDVMGRLAQRIEDNDDERVEKPWLRSS